MSADLHAYVCTPAYNGQVNSEYSQSLAQTALLCAEHQVRLTPDIIKNVYFLEVARNMFVKRFLQEHADATHLFFIDGDLQFEPSAFFTLLKSGLPICGAEYRRREPMESYQVRPALNDGKLCFDGRWLQCTRVASGFLCISRSVLEEMAADAPIVTRSPGERVPLLFELKYEDSAGFEKVAVPEDWTFCDKYVARYRRDIPVWTDCTFSHDGFAGNFNDYIHRYWREALPVTEAVRAA
jgi:hypothetical protein